MQKASTKMTNFEVPLRSPSSNCLSGILLKWTNYLYGWQERYFVLKQDGTLLYYRSQDEIAFGCRGGIKLELACVSLHEFDECRFDIAVGDCIWYLRAYDVKGCDQWVEAFVNPEKAFSSGINLKIDSTLDYVEKLSDIETSRDILYGQIQNLRHYFDISINSASLMIQKLKKLDSPTNVSASSSTSLDSGFFEKRNNSPNNENEDLLGEIKREILTFKATTADLINSLSNCIDVLNQRENQWKDKLEKEQVERKAIEKQFKRAFVEFEANRRVEAEFHFDLEKEKPVIKLEQNQHFENESENGTILKEDLKFYDAMDVDYFLDSEKEKKLGKTENIFPCNHELWLEIENVTNEQFYKHKLEDSVSWELILKDGEMRIYRQDMEINGIVCDPYKMIYTVTGVTAHELCLQYYSLDNRFAIDPNVESCKVLEKLDSNTSIVHMIFKRFWPTAQRDFVFWSHIRQFSGDWKSTKSPTPENIWTVVNKSCSRQDFESASHCVRVEGSSVFTCETFIDPPVKYVSELTRNHLKCKITYSSQMNPGGWVPASLVRAGVKREFPKFVKALTQFSIDHYRDKPIMM